jgi:cellulose synthase/poly-beta-1,6-N-acetylglucosamine synthase-like glycosyltransferase
MQYARGEFVYVLDGDMQLMPDFLAVALQELDDDPRLAGVAGLLREAYTMNYSSAGRERRRDLSQAAQTVVALDGGALYRRAAIEDVRYLANPSLHAFEEFDLGSRLVSKGWTLRRLDVQAVLHKGYTCASIPLMVRRWRTRYAWGHGELLRAAIGQPHLRIVLTHLRILKINVLTVGLWMLIMVLLLAGASAPPWGWILAAAVWPVVWAAVAFRRRSGSSAAISLLAWNVTLAGLVCGFLAWPRRCPDEPLPAVVIR